MPFRFRAQHAFSRRAEGQLRAIGMLVSLVLLLSGLCFSTACAVFSRGDGAEHLQYYPDGKLKQWTRLDGTPVRYEYSKLGRLSRLRYGLSSVNFGYDAAHYLLTVQNASGTVKFKRDAIGRVAEVDSPTGQKISYDYDPWGRVISMSISGGHYVNYKYDVIGRLATIDWGEGPTSYEYRPGEIRRTLPNGVSTTFSFSPTGVLAAIRHERAGGMLICSYRYTYNPDGRVSSVEEDTAGSRTAIYYQYDLGGRLTEVRSSSGQVARYTYDALGNRTSYSDGRTTVHYQYDVRGRLVRSGPVNYRYDQCGNLISKADAEAHALTRYDYDHAGRLAGFRRGNVRTLYFYDGLGNQIKRQETGRSTCLLNDLTTRLARVVGEFDSSGKLLASYVYGDSVLARRDTQGQTSYYLTDRLGSVRFVVDRNGNTLRRYDYTPFGEPIGLGDNDTNTYGFSGERWDREIGLLYLRARYYDPLTGRFITRDPRAGPVTTPQSLNRYIYAADDPINLRDRAGLGPQDGFDSGDFGAQGAIDSSPPTVPGYASQPDRAQDFVTNWNPNSQPQLQFPQESNLADEARAFAAQTMQMATNPADTLNSAVSIASDALTPGAIHGVAWAAPRLPSDTAKSPLPTLLEAMNIVRNSAKLSGGGVDWTEAVGSWVPVHCYSQAAGPIENTNTASGLGTSAAAWSLRAMQSQLGVSLAALSAGEQAIETAAQWGGIPKALAENATHSVYTAPAQEFNGLNNVMADGAEAIASGLSSDLFQQTAQSALNNGLDELGINSRPSGGIPDDTGEAGQPPVGGIRLGQNAELSGNLGTITGAVLDPQGGRVVLVGDKSTALPPMRTDDLAVALHAAYSDDPHEPAMSIDPNPHDPMGPFMNVVFFGNTQNTHLGSIMFEADRLMKGYSTGRDNISKAEVHSGVRDYHSVLQLDFANSGRGYHPHLWSRFWLVPECVAAFVSPDGQSILLGKTKIRVKTETMRWAGSKLVPSGGQIDETAEVFAKNFTDHYEEFARESPVYAELERLAQVVAIAKWMKAAGIPIDQHWIQVASSQPYLTPSTTPSVTNTETRTWEDGRYNHVQTVRVFGGTDLGLTLAYKRNAPRAGQFGMVVRGALTSAANPATFDVVMNGKRQGATSIPVSEAPHYGAFATANVDLLARAGETTIPLERFYSSFNNAPTAFGKSWSLLLPHLYLQTVGPKGRVETISVKGKPNTEVKLQRFQLTDDLGQMNVDFSEHFIDQEWQRIAFRPRQQSTLYRGLYPNPDGTYVLVFSNGNQWLFDHQGQVISTSGPGAKATQYVYVKQTGRLLTIMARASSRVTASIQFQYDAMGRIASAQTENGEKVQYSYDRRGDLTNVSRQGEPISYSYDDDHTLVSEARNGNPLFRNQYDTSGRWTQRQDGSGRVVAEQHFQRLKNGGELVTRRYGAIVIQLTYDNRLKLTSRETSDGARDTYFYYDTGLIRRIERVDGEGAKEVVEFSSDHHQVDFTDPRGMRRQFRFREDGKLAQILVNGQLYASYTYDSRGGLTMVDYGAFREHFRHDEYGKFTGEFVEVLGPGQSRAAGSIQELSIAYDSTGGLSGIKAPGWEAVRQVGKAPNEAVVTLGQAVSRTLFDSRGRLGEIRGPQDRTVVYGYDPNGLLSKVTVRSGPQSAEYSWQGSRLHEVTNFAGGITRYEYDDAGRLVAVTDGCGETNRLYYDSRGRLMSVLAPTGKQVDYIYDDAGRPTRIAEHP